MVGWAFFFHQHDCTQNTKIRKLERDKKDNIHINILLSTYPWYLCIIVFVITFNLCCTFTHILTAPLFRPTMEWVPNPCPTQVFHTSCFTRRSSCLCCDSTGSSQTCPSALKASGFHPSKNTGVYGATGPLSWELRGHKESVDLVLVALGFYFSVTKTMITVNIVPSSFWKFM